MTYDLVGNRPTSTGVPNYTVNSSNQLTSTSNATYTYDNNGNMLTKTDSSGTTTYAWDFENRLTSVTLPASGGTVSFVYDPFGRRIRKSTSTTTSVYVYDGADQLQEVDSAGTTVVARYTTALSIDQPLAVIRGGVTSFYELDAQGSVTSLSNSAAAVANTYTYDTFGNQTTFTGSVVNPFRYTARELDSETGLMYYRARYYEPTLGRFLSEDPLRFGAGDTDFYSYVHNGPLIYRDPSGRTKVHGNWCGPDWTGGKVEEYNPGRNKNGYYNDPLDAEDEVCKHHDICYFNCRSQYPCDKGERKKCLTNCDYTLIGSMPSTKTGDTIAAGIYWHPADPDGDEHCGCKKKVEFKHIDYHARKF
jgi:RHS repeat-associated protein